jgi:hypothetical protein
VSKDEILEIKISREKLEDLQSLLNRYYDAIEGGKIKKFENSRSATQEMDLISGYVNQFYKVLVAYIFEKK